MNQKKITDASTDCSIMNYDFFADGLSEEFSLESNMSCVLIDHCCYKGEMCEICEPLLNEDKSVDKDYEEVTKFQQSYQSYVRRKTLVGGRPFKRKMNELNEYWKSIMPRLYHYLRQMIENQGDLLLLHHLQTLKTELQSGKKRKKSHLKIFLDGRYSFNLLRCLTPQNYRKIVQQTQLQSPLIQRIYIDNRIPVLALLYLQSDKDYLSQQSYYHFHYKTQQYD